MKATNFPRLRCLFGIAITAFLVGLTAMFCSIGIAQDEPVLTPSPFDSPLKGTPLEFPPEKTIIDLAGITKEDPIRTAEIERIGALFEQYSLPIKVVIVPSLTMDGHSYTMASDLAINLYTQWNKGFTVSKSQETLKPVCFLYVISTEGTPIQGHVPNINFEVLCLERVKPFDVNKPDKDLSVLDRDLHDAARLSLDQVRLNYPNYMSGLEVAITGLKKDLIKKGRIVEKKDKEIAEIIPASTAQIREKDDSWVSDAILEPESEEERRKIRILNPISVNVPEASRGGARSKAAATGWSPNFWLILLIIVLILLILDLYLKRRRS